MVDRQLAFGVLQLVALSLPAFTILLQIIVESEMAYTHLAVPITTAGMVLFTIAGAIILGELVVATTSAITTLALGILLLGVLCLLIGASLIGWQTETKQSRIRDGD